MRLDTAETRLRRLQAAIEAGADPAAFVEAINEAQSQCAAARSELDGTAAPEGLYEEPEIDGEWENVRSGRVSWVAAERSS